MILSMCCCIPFAIILMRIFVSIFFLRYWPVIFYSYNIFFLFMCQSTVGLIEWVWKWFLSLNFSNALKSLGILHYISDGTPLWRCPALDFCLLGDFLKNKYNFTSSDQSVQIVLSFWFSLGRSYVSKNLSISFKLSNFWLITVNSILLWFSFMCVPLRYQILFILYHFLSLFFLVSMVKDLSILFIFSKYEFLVSLIFSVVFDLIIIYLLSHTYYFFLLLTLGFVSSFI